MPAPTNRATPISIAAILLATTMLAVALGAPFADAASFAGFGVDAGVGVARFEGDYGNAAEKSRASVSGGASAHFGLGGPFSFRPGVAWISKGGKVDAIYTVTSGTDVTRVHIKATWIVDCVEAPLLVHWEPPSGSFAVPFIAVGPGLSWRVATDARSDFTEGSELRAERVRFANIFEEVGSLDFLERLHRFDVDAIVGTGVTLGRGRTRVTLEARYLHGLRDLVPGNSASSLLPKATAYHRAFTMTAGIQLR